MHRVAVAMGLAALIAATPVHAQEKTPANAFEFIRANMSDGTWQGWTEFCDGAGSCEIEDTPIRSVAYEENSYCVIRVGLQGDRMVYRTIDLRKNFSIEMDYYRHKIRTAGPVRKGNGEIDDSWWAWGSSQELTIRVKEALAYLASACGPQGPW